MNASRNSRWLIGTLLLFLAMGLARGPLSGQYYGRNKVQYEKFDFKILKTKHFDVYFYPSFKSSAELAARLAERWYARHSRVLNHELRGRQALILYASPTHFQQTTVISEILGEGTGGVTESYKRRIVLPLGASLAETDHVIGHELVHAFQYDMLAPAGMGNNGQGSAIERLPLWFIEGMAEYMSIGPVDPHTSMWMREAIQRKDFPTVKKLDSSRYFPYRYGQALWAYMCGRWGDEIISRLIRGLGRAGDYKIGLEKILNIKIDQLSKDWIDSLKKASASVMQGSNLTDPSSRVLVKGTEQNMYNISPSVSPDGKQVISFSTRDMFSIDMYLADVKTGHVEKRITRTATDPEFESLQFIYSSGSWEPSGRRFAFGAVSKGKPILSFFDVNEKSITQEIPVAGVDGIMSPSWSPDSRSIVFSGMSGGMSDLYIYDIDQASLKRMTNDIFADLMPTWSPDGKWIAFVTDRFTTDVSILNTGDYEVALMNPVSGEIRKVAGFTGAKNINPQWSPDSKSIYFLSDQSGKSDIYRLDLASERIYQVTNMFTGVSGITEMSPAISFAHSANALVYSGYDTGKYTLYSVDSADALQGKPALADFGGRNMAVLPPRNEPSGALLGLIRNPLFGLPEDETFPEAEYKPKLSLSLFATPQVGVGVDRFGTYTGGGVTLLWSDMLGYHNLYTMAQTSSRIKETAAIVAYQNSQYRLNWGVVAQRIPYVTGYYDYYIEETTSGPIEVFSQNLYWQINYDISGFLSYPLSQVQRIEVTGGYRYIDFSIEQVVDKYFYGYSTQIAHDIIDLPSPAGLSMPYLSAALVHDSSVLGATGPVVGQIYALQYSPTFGSLNFSQILADYRRYFMPVRPFTLAFRILHYGRYGKDAEDVRLWPLYIGYDGLVRGYDYTTFSVDEGDFDFNRLIGSKMLVANAEIRFPLFGVLGLGRGYYGVFPVDFLAFYDIGVAWDSQNKPTFLSNGTRKPVRSLGVGLRANMFGYLVLGLNYVKPLDRPNKGWYLAFSIYPGF